MQWKCGKRAGGGGGAEGTGAFPTFPLHRRLRRDRGGKGQRSHGQELAAGVAGFGVESNQELMGEGDEDHFFSLAGGGEALGEGGEIGMVAAHHAGDDEQKMTYCGAAAANGAPAVASATLVGERGQADEFADGLVGEGADLGKFGHEAGNGAVGHALDGAEGVIEVVPERVGVDELGDAVLQLADLGGEEGEQAGEGFEHDRVGDQEPLLELGSAGFGELAQAGDERAELIVCAGLGRMGDQFLVGCGILGDEGGVNGVGLFQPPHGLGEVAHGTRVAEGDGQAGGPELAIHAAFVTAAGFDGDPIDVVLLAEGQQIGDAGDGVGETLAARVEENVEELRRNIDSTNDLGHGNLPCACDGMGLATVRSYVTWAAVPKLSVGEQSPQDEREPSARGEPMPRLPTATSSSKICR